MKLGNLKCWLTMVLLLFAAPAMATSPWVLLLDNEKGRAYVGTDRLDYPNGVIKVSGLQEPKDPVVLPQGTVMSVRSVEEYNCNSRRSRILILDFRAGLGGSGASLLRNDAVGEWREISGLFAEAMWRHLCPPGNPKQPSKPRILSP